MDATKTTNPGADMDATQIKVLRRTAKCNARGAHYFPVGQNDRAAMALANRGLLEETKAGNGWGFQITDAGRAALSEVK